MDCWFIDGFQGSVPYGIVDGCGYPVWPGTQGPAPEG